MAYELVLPGSVRQAVLEIELAEQRQVAKTLREELWCQEGSSPLTMEIPDPSHPEHRYFAAALSSGYVAIFRCLTAKELKQRGSKYQEGRVIFQLLSIPLPEEPKKRRWALLRAARGD